MCGFIGEFGRTLLSEQDFRNLLDLSKKRGPDNQQIFRIDNQLQLGFNRLSIQDLSDHGNQPYHSPNQNFDFVFNGEIYNCEELISKFNLDRTKFRSTSDTEVIAQLLETTTIETIASELNGMFAIAIFDRSLQTVTLLRDFAGIKPLFYGIHSNGLVFASQFNQVYKHPAMKDGLTVNASVLKEYFALGYMQSPNTIYTNVLQVEPGCMVSYSISKREMVTKNFLSYQHSNPTNQYETNSHTAKEADRIINNVVKRQLVSDAPIGTFLSGGIDSPIITAVASKQKKDIRSFTLKLEHAMLDESVIAKKYASHLQVDNVVACFNANEIVKLVDEHFDAYSEPFGDYSSIPTYLICKLASNEFKVLLSGDGADELFWGYPRFYNTLKYASWFRLPQFARRGLAKLQRKLGYKVSYGVSAPSIGAWVLNQHSHNKMSIVDSFFKTTPSISTELAARYNYKQASPQTLMPWLRYNEYYGHMQRVLIKVDRASMGNSLEVRVPFLDKEIVNYAFKIKPDLNNKNPKYILKQIIRKYFPEELINSRKMGFSMDIESVLKQYCKDDFMKLLSSEKIVGRDLLDMHQMEKYIQEYYSEKHHNSWGVWIIYAYFKWCEKHA